MILISGIIAISFALGALIVALIIAQAVRPS